MIFFNPSPKLTGQEKRSIATYFGSSYQDQSIENNAKIILTRVLKRCIENKSSAQSSTCVFTFYEIGYLKKYYIELKYYPSSYVIYSKSDVLYVVMSP